MSEQQFPPGWDEARVKQVLDHYENLSEDELVAEDEAAREAERLTDTEIAKRLSLVTEVVTPIERLPNRIRVEADCVIVTSEKTGAERRIPFQSIRDRSGEPSNSRIIASFREILGL